MKFYQIIGMFSMSLAGFLAIPLMRTENVIASSTILVGMTLIFLVIIMDSNLMEIKNAILTKSPEVRKNEAANKHKRTEQRL